MLLASATTAAANMADDLVFAGLDLAGGYKTAGQIGNELGRKAVTSAISVGTGFAGEQLVANPEGQTLRAWHETVTGHLNT